MASHHPHPSGRSSSHAINLIDDDDDDPVAKRPRPNTSISLPEAADGDAAAAQGAAATSQPQKVEAQEAIDQVRPMEGYAGCRYPTCGHARESGRESGRERGCGWGGCVEQRDGDLFWVLADDWVVVDTVPG